MSKPHRSLGNGVGTQNSKDSEKKSVGGKMATLPNRAVQEEEDWKETTGTVHEDGGYKTTRAHR